jgi:hypothetical protein
MAAIALSLAEEWFHCTVHRNTNPAGGSGGQSHQPSLDRNTRPFDPPFPNRRQVQPLEKIMADLR